MLFDFLTLFKNLGNWFRRYGNVTYVKKEAEIFISQGTSVERGYNLKCPVYCPTSEPPTDDLCETIPPNISHLYGLRCSVEAKGKSPFTSVVSPSGSSSSSSPVTPFHIKALKESPKTSLLEYSNQDVNGNFTMTSLTTVGEDLHCRDLIHNTNICLKQFPPTLCTLGTGGVYFIRSCTFMDHHQNHICSVFKPTDEEPGEKNNPKGYCCNSSLESVDGGRGLRDGFKPGDGALRERAAYLLDYDSISGIPPTAIVLLKSFSMESGIEKIGSLQQYVPFDFDAEECGTGLFPVEEVHKICLADIRFINKDRNGQNILISRRTMDGKVILTPIDHGYCFPDNFKDIYFEWMFWPQAKHTFGSKILKFIENLDPRKDLDVLFQHGIEFHPDCIRVFLFSTYFLKWAVRHQYTLRDIAIVMSNAPGSSVSKLESIFQLVLQQQNIHEKQLNQNLIIESEVYQALDRYLKQPPFIVL